MRRLKENDLFVKPEKCVWKVREVELLEVVIREDGVRMEKKKVQGPDIIVLVSSTMFQIYDIKLCNYIHVSFYQPKGRVASTKECEGCTEVFGVGKLL